MLEKHLLLLSFYEVVITHQLCIRDCSKLRVGHRDEKDTIIALKFTSLIKIVSKSWVIHVNYQNKIKHNQEEKLRVLFPVFVIKIVFEEADFSIPMSVSWKRR